MEVTGDVWPDVIKTDARDDERDCDLIISCLSENTYSPLLMLAKPFAR